MAKGAGAKAAKAASAQDKADRQAAAAEAAEAAKWDEGSSKKGNKKADKDAEAARKREEKARLQAEEEEATNSIKPKAGAGGGKKNKDQAPKKVSSFKVPDLEVASVNASGIDNVLDGLDVATGKTDKASLGSKAAKDIDTHPERRFKGAFEAYCERELPVLKEEHKGLRLQQYKDILYKQFQKSEENPFNQTTAAYNSTKEDKVDIVQQKRQDAEKRLGNMSL